MCIALSSHVRRCTRRTISRRVGRCLRPHFFGSGEKRHGTPCSGLGPTRVRGLLIHTVGRASHCHNVGGTNCSSTTVHSAFGIRCPVHIFTCANDHSAVVSPVSSVHCCGRFLHMNFVSVSPVANCIGTCINKPSCARFRCSVTVINHHRINSAVGPCLCALTVRGKFSPYSRAHGIRRAVLARSKRV